MKRTLFFLFYCFPTILISQNWQNVCSPGTTFYTDTAGNMAAFRLDSLIFLPNSDTIYYSYRTIRDSLTAMTCSDTSYGSILGFRVILTHDGWYYLFNRFGDTMKINTNAGLNQSWRFCEMTGGGYIKATVSAIMTDSVIGQPDLVKYITLQAKNAGGTNISHPLNGHLFKFSKNYGLVTFYDVYHLPETVKTYTLVGKSSPSLGLQDFTWQDVYDFSVGDEFHYQGWGEDMGGSSTWKRIEVVMNKIVYGNLDSVDYVIVRCSRTEGGPPPGVVTSHDTITIGYNFLTLDTSNFFMSLPDEFRRVDFFADRNTRRSGVFHERQVKINEGAFFVFGWSIPACWSIGLWESWSKFEYAPGLGCTFHEMIEMWWSTGESLVYFHKGDETWGIPVSTDCNTLVDQLEIPSLSGKKVTVAPNPWSSETVISVADFRKEVHLELHITDLTGKTVFREDAFKSPYRLYRNGLPAGIYFMTITSGADAFHTKLILQ